MDHNITVKFQKYYRSMYAWDGCDIDDLSDEEYATGEEISFDAIEYFEHGMNAYWRTADDCYWVAGLETWGGRVELSEIDKYNYDLAKADYIKRKTK